MFKLSIVVSAAELGDLAALLTSNGHTFDLVAAGDTTSRSKSVASVRKAIIEAPRTARADAGQTRSAAVQYVISNRVNVARIKAMTLTPQQSKVALYVAKNGPVSNAEIAAATGIKGKSVESAVYQLRHSTPVVLKSEAVAE